MKKKLLKTKNVILNSVEQPWKGGYKLCFQKIETYYPDQKTTLGYRHMWKLPSGKHQGYLGGTRIPSKAIYKKLEQKAVKEGWFI